MPSIAAASVRSLERDSASSLAFAAAQFASRAAAADSIARRANQGLIHTDVPVPPCQSHPGPVQQFCSKVGARGDGWQPALVSQNRNANLQLSTLPGVYRLEVHYDARDALREHLCIGGALSAQRGHPDRLLAQRGAHCMQREQWRKRSDERLLVACVDASCVLAQQRHTTDRCAARVEQRHGKWCTVHQPRNRAPRGRKRAEFNGLLSESSGRALSVRTEEFEQPFLPCCYSQQGQLSALRDSAFGGSDLIPGSECV
eukprot:scaffold110628_cov30-Tisochrysis_lutea.AAC.8